MGKSKRSAPTGTQDGSRALPIFPEAKPVKNLKVPYFQWVRQLTHFPTLVPESKTDKIKKSHIFRGGAGG